MDTNAPAMSLYDTVGAFGLLGVIIALGILAVMGLLMPIYILMIHATLKRMERLLTWIAQRMK